MAYGCYNNTNNKKPQREEIRENKDTSLDFSPFVLQLDCLSICLHLYCLNLNNTHSYTAEPLGSSFWALLTLLLGRLQCL